MKWNNYLKITDLNLTNNGMCCFSFKLFKGRNTASNLLLWLLLSRSYWKPIKINSNHGAELMQSGSPAGWAVEGCSQKFNSRNSSLNLTKHCCKKVKESKTHSPGISLTGRKPDSSIFFIDFTGKHGFKREAPLQWQSVFLLLRA